MGGSATHWPCSRPTLGRVLKRDYRIDSRQEALCSPHRTAVLSLDTMPPPRYNGRRHPGLESGFLVAIFFFLHKNFILSVASRRRHWCRHHDAGQASAFPSSWFGPRHHHITLRLASRPPHLSRVTSRHFTRPRQHYYLNILQHCPPPCGPQATAPWLSPHTPLSPL